MQLSRKADYALRAVRFLSTQPKGKLGSINAIAASESVPREFLAKILKDLTRSGILVSFQGVTGGYRLARPPREIKVREILEAVQGPMELTECVYNPDICLNSSFCEARMVWVIASERMMEIFDTYSLADLIDKHYKDKMREKYPEMKLLNPDKYLAEGSYQQSCPAIKNK